MSLLTLIQGATRRIGINAPSYIVGNTDDEIIQLLNLANEEGEELADRYRWQNLIYEGSFTTVATASQGAITAAAPENYQYILNDTIWNRDQQRPVLGPLAPRDWQMMQASPVSGPYDQFRIVRNTIYFDPTPTAGQSCYFEYVTGNWCEDSSGTGQSEWQADDDVGRLDEKIMRMGLIWRWKQVKGFAYAEDFNKYEARVANAMARDGGKQDLDLAGGEPAFVPGVFVPQGGYGT